MFEIFKKLFYREKTPLSKSAKMRIEELYESMNTNELTIYAGSDLIPFSNAIGSKIWMLREKLFEDTGFIMPAVRIKSEEELQENEYCISVRNRIVFVGFAVFNEDFAPDEIAKSLEDTCIQYIDEVFSNAVTEKYIDFVQNESRRLISELLRVTDITSLRIILINLLKDGQSIKDISLIFEKVCEYFCKDICPKQDPKIIAEFVKQNMPVM